MKTAIVLIVFNRPNPTQQVFNAIREAKPSKLFVVADGPRRDRPEDLERCLAARAIIEQVDWDCEVFKRYSDVNLGCRRSISQGISWVFDQVEEAIILEDDCLPQPSFFPYCEELLERYRFDKRIMHIAGNNPCYKEHSLKFSYTFSRYPLCWGWATWKRAWDYYDGSIKKWPEICNSDFLKDILPDNRLSRKTWNRIFQTVYDNKIDSWAYQWVFTCWLQSGFSLIPEYNLVKNIGFGADATHTFDDSLGIDVSSHAINFPLNHPDYVMRDRQADYTIQYTFYNYDRTIFQRLVGKLKKMKTFQI